MGFWEWIGVFLFYWVLSGNYNEGFWEWVCFFFNGNLFFLYCFKEGRLGFWWRFVNFVGEEYVSEYWVFFEFEFEGFLVEDVYINDVVG